jgi:uncharacterized phiE125 gp8 family phage protein
MFNTLTRTTPSVEPVSLDMAKRHLELDVDDWDSWIAEKITAARQEVESYTQRVFAACTATATFDDFPRRECERTNGLPAIRLPLLAESVESVTYIDAAGDEQELTESTDWLASLARVPTLIYPAPNKVWPNVQAGRTDRVTVEFTPRIDDVERGNAAILLILGHQFENRGGQDNDIPPAALRIMNGLMRPMYT